MLADDLIGREYRDVTVLRISRSAIEIARERLGAASTRVYWLHADVMQAAPQEQTYDVWHYRAVFHFYQAGGTNRVYTKCHAALKSGGHVIVGTFGPAGPEERSGLDVVRYDAESLHDEFG